MSLLWSSALLGLAWFAAINMITGLAMWGLARILLQSTAAASLSARALLALRLAPAGAAALFAGAIFLPVHVWFEPLDAGESFGVVLAALALIAAAMLGRGLLRLAAVLRQDWSLRATSRMTPLDRQTGAYDCEGFSGISLAGVLRTRIFVGSAARAALTASELAAAVEHERAHQAARDNLKRVAMFCAPDVFGWSRIAREIEARWRAEAECLADSKAAAGDASRAVELASALVKVARLGTDAPSALRTPIWSTFHEPALLATRVRRLLDAATPGNAVHGSPTWRGTLTAALVVLAPVFLWATGAALDLHRLTELLVRTLP